MNLYKLEKMVRIGNIITISKNNELLFNHTVPEHISIKIEIIRCRIFKGLDEEDIINDQIYNLTGIPIKRTRVIISNESYIRSISLNSKMHTIKEISLYATGLSFRVLSDPHGSNIPIVDIKEVIR